MKIDKKLIKELVENLKEFGLTELEYQEGQTKIKVSKASKAIEHSKANTVVSQNKTVLKSIDDNDGIRIKSPIIGTAYLATEPGAKKFVEVGDKIKKGQTVMIVEAMAQVSGLLGFATTGEKADDGKVYLFAGVDKVRFKRPVVPGDQLMLTSEIEAVKRNIWRFRTTATVDGKTCCEATLLCAYQDKESLA